MRGHCWHQEQSLGPSEAPSPSPQGEAGGKGEEAAEEDRELRGFIGHQFFFSGNTGPGQRKSILSGYMRTLWEDGLRPGCAGCSRGAASPGPRTAPVRAAAEGCAHAWVLASELMLDTHAGLTVNAGGAERGGQGRSSGVLTGPDHVFLALDLTHPQPWASGGRAHTGSHPRPYKPSVGSLWWAWQHLKVKGETSRPECAIWRPLTGNLPPTESCAASVRPRLGTCSTDKECETTLDLGYMLKE